MKTPSTAALAASIATTLVLTASSWAQVIMSSPLLPPDGNDIPTGLPAGYLSPAAVHAMFSGPGLVAVLKDVKHHRFSLISRMPGPGGSEIESFQSTLDAMLSINAGPFMPFSAVGPVMTRVDYGGGGPLGTFTTEMLSLDLVGGGAMIRESPTLASQGVTQVNNAPGGFLIDSFFDVFTELSVDGGATWMPNSEGGGSTHVSVQPVPEPGSISLLAAGVAGLVGFVRRRKQA